MSNAERLKAIVFESSASDVARALDSEESSVRSWATGRTKPKEPWRTRLEAKYALSRDGWGDVAPTKKTETTNAKPWPAPKLDTLTSASKGEDFLDVSIRYLKDLYDRAATDGGVRMRDRIAIAKEITSVGIRLAKLRGEDSSPVTERRILRSPAWRRISKTVLDVLEEELGGAAGDAAGDVMRKIGEALVELGEGETS